MGNVPATGKYFCPLPAGFPQNRSPLKGNPPFWGKPSALGHEGYRGRRLCGAAMLCRLQCARFAKRVAHCRRTLRLALGTHFVAADLQEGCALCKFGWAAPLRKRDVKFKHTPNKCTWDSRTLRKRNVKFRLHSEQVYVGFRHASNKYTWESGSTPNKCTWESSTLRISARRARRRPLLPQSAERRYFDEEQGRHPVHGCVAYSFCPTRKSKIFTRGPRIREQSWQGA